MLAVIAFVLVAVATLVWISFAWRVTMPANRMPFLAAWSMGALLSIIVLVGGAPGTGLAVAALLLSGSLLLLAATSRQRAEPRLIAVGDAIPRFTACDDNGDPVPSSTFAGQRLLLKFFRGHW